MDIFMINRIGHVSLIVADQEQAAQFYTEKYGFVITESHKAPEGGYYWITVAPCKESALEITLMLPTTAQDKALIGKQAGSIPLFVFLTDDCRKTCEELKARGVEFTKEPTDEFWGVDAICKDLYGNLIDICQPAPQQ